ncbi:MAG: hypothetical protein K940chlam8_00599 [Chlamydiae bacterium]|nr:hypothetical protein [Chlamydiota bacterium]
MKEHYGIEVSSSAVRKLTEEHANKIAQWQPQEKVQDVELLIAEVDGSMVPIVELEEKTDGIDLRKKRKVCWKEAKLCFSRGHKKITKNYGAVIGSAEDLGKKLHECAKRTGFVDKKTYVHAIGDGAQWIVDQIDDQFGSQAHFLIDFFHVCEYLAEASSWCDVLNSKGWLEEKKKMLKAGESKKVFLEMKTRLAQLEDPPKENGLEKCVRYMGKRVEYMTYGQAKEKGLPIGSGEIESSHRHIGAEKVENSWSLVENR